MKKIILSMFCLMVLLGFIVRAEKVSQESALRVAKNFFFEKQFPVHGLTLDNISVKNIFPVKNNGLIIYYGISLSPSGFVIVSADDGSIPVLGYSFEGEFSGNNYPENFKGWMQHYQDQIVEIIEKKIMANSEIKAEWEYWLSENTLTLNPFRSSKGVLPLVVSNWDQGKFYNEYCPVDAAGPDDHCVTGCVATAMGQILYYYRWPLSGLGSYTYQHPDYGTITANFGNTNYRWEEMENKLTSPNTAVAELLFHQGVSVDMNYGPGSSGMTNHKAAYSLRTYFKSVPETQYLFRDSISLDWDSIILRHLDRKQILYYAGWAGVGSTSGHAFVCDGYQDSTYFHFNWGWGGSYDGYFYLNALNPSGGNFNYAQELIINIYPDTNLYTYPNPCNGLTTIHSPKGTIEDGSGPIKNYQPNSTCTWLIDPQINPEDTIKNLALNFNKLDTENGMDIITIYDGPSTSSPVIGTFSGNTIPTSTIISTGNKVLISFQTNSTDERNGWLISYKSLYPSFCSNAVLSDPTGSINDGSLSKKYMNNTSCTWSIKPENASGIVLHFTSFDLEPINDFVEIYDLVTQALIGKYSGNSLPPDITVNSGEMYIVFKTNSKIQAQGWSATYTITNLSVDEKENCNLINIFPNPADNLVVFERMNGKPECINLKILNISSQLLKEITFNSGYGYHKESIQTDKLAEGMYYLQILTDTKLETRKLIIRHP